MFELGQARWWRGTWAASQCRARGHRRVPAAVPEHHRGGDRRQSKPQGHEGEVVVAPPGVAAPRAVRASRPGGVADAGGRLRHRRAGGGPPIGASPSSAAALGASMSASSSRARRYQQRRRRTPGSCSRPCRPSSRRPHARTAPRRPTEPAARHRSGSSAAQASAWGPPPDHPKVRKRSTPRLSSTGWCRPRRRPRRPGCGDDPPYPGLEWTTVRRPASAAASASPGGSSAAPGVPWWKTRTSPSAGPATETSRDRPSGVRTVAGVSPARSAGSRSG